MTINLDLKNFVEGIFVGSGCTVIAGFLVEGTSTIDNISLLNVVTGGTSIVLALVAISVSLYHYERNKKTEKEVSEALAGIKSQTDTLKDLTGDQIKRLTEAVIRTRFEEPESARRLDESLAESPSVDSISEDEFNQQAVINAYVYSYFYILAANVALQMWFIRERRESWVKGALDLTYREATRLDQLLDSLEPRLKTAAPSNGLYELARNTWLKKGLIKNASTTTTNWFQFTTATPPPPAS